MPSCKQKATPVNPLCSCCSIISCHSALLRCSRLGMPGFLRKRNQSIQRYDFLQVRLAGRLPYFTTITINQFILKTGVAFGHGMGLKMQIVLDTNQLVTSSTKLCVILPITLVASIVTGYGPVRVGNHVNWPVSG